MIKFLSTVGRVTIVVAALLMILGFGLAGFFESYAGGVNGYLASYTGHAVHLGTHQTVAFIAGCVIGSIVAGTIFGPLATLYDVRDSLRQLVKRAEQEERASTTLEVREPTLN